MSSLIINIITFLYIFFKINPGNADLALKYNVIAGVEWYGQGINLYLIPATGLVILIINYLFYYRTKNKPSFLNFFIGFATLTTELILFLAIILLIRIN